MPYNTEIAGLSQKTMADYRRENELLTHYPIELKLEMIALRIQEQRDEAEYIRRVNEMHKVSD